jgi:hypothetical protein
MAYIAPRDLDHAGALVAMYTALSHELSKE